MSEYVSKKAVLEWLDDRRYKSPWIESFRDRLESGAFDADESEGTWKATSEFAFRLNSQLEAEIQRLRTALKDDRKMNDREKKIEEIRVERRLREILNEIGEVERSQVDKSKMHGYFMQKMWKILCAEVGNEKADEILEKFIEEGVMDYGLSRSEFCDVSVRNAERRR